MWNDLLIGCCAGATQVIAGHPLDTVKVLQQSGNSWKGLMLKDYYRGGLATLPNAVMKNSIIMPVFFKIREKTDNDFISGGIAGLVSAPTQYMFDFMKIKKQTYKKYEMKDIIRGKGKVLTMTKESLGFGLYFKSYYYCKDELKLSAPISGGISGLSLWSILYPLDTLKTRQISGDIKLKDALKKGRLYSGFGPCVLRSMVANSAIWTVVDTLKSLK